jgi:hypothetical protein
MRTDSITHWRFQMKTLAVLTIAAASLFSGAAHANDIDHWAGDDGKRPYYAPGYDQGYVRSFNSFNGVNPGTIVVAPAQRWGEGVVQPRHRRTVR